MSHVRISKRVMCTALIPEGMTDVILGLEPMETIRVIGTYGNPDILVVVNSHPIYPIDVTVGNAKYPNQETIRSIIVELSQKSYFIDATEMAMGLGAPILANIIMVGALLALEILPLTMEDIVRTLAETFATQKVQVNLKALQVGADAVRKNQY